MIGGTPEKRVRRNVCGIACTVVIGVVCLTIGLAAWSTHWLSGTMCDNQVISTSLTPDHRLKAVVFERDCGATTGFSTQVSVLLASQKLTDEAGNALVVDDNRGAARSGPGGGPMVHIAWAGNRSLLVRFDSRARVVSQRDHIRIPTSAFRSESVSVRYDPKPVGRAMPTSPQARRIGK